MASFVGIGDLHLTSSLGKGGLSGYVKDHDKAVVLAVRRALAYAKRNQVRHVFLYGDVCEAPRMSYSGQIALLSFLRMDFDFHIILGNHDKFGELSSAGHSLEIIKELRLPNVHIYEDPTLVKIEGQPINFLPWPYCDFDARALNVAHVDVQGAKTDSGRAVTKGTDSRAFAVVGHIHTHQQVRNTFYSGTLYQTNFGESQSKFFHHGRYEDGWEIESIAAKPKYVLHNLVVENKKDLVKLARSIPEADTKNHLVKVILKDGANISATDYLHLNVVKTVTASNQREIALAQVEDLNDGSEVEVSSDEFFQEWLENQSQDAERKASASALRTKMLKDVHK